MQELEVERLRLEAAAKQAAATSAASSAAAAAAATATGPTGEAKKGKGFNLNTVVNQLLDVTIPPLTREEMIKLYKVYVDAEDGPPGK